MKEKLEQMKYSARSVEKLKHDVRSWETVVDRRNREKKSLKAEIDSLEKKLQEERKTRKKIDVSFFYFSYLFLVSLVPYFQDPESELSQVWKKYAEKQKAILNLQAEVEVARKIEHDMGIQLETCSSGENLF